MTDARLSVPGSPLETAAPASFLCRNAALARSRRSAALAPAPSERSRFPPLRKHKSCCGCAARSSITATRSCRAGFVPSRRKKLWDFEAENRNRDRAGLSFAGSGSPIESRDGKRKNASALAGSGVNGECRAAYTRLPAGRTVRFR